ncbi:MAG: Helix-turn-helix domain [Bacteroidetes bacterium]|jgi:transcriptional regulator with XRE-family HTH domain|nr:Helix-turn-helix domain [Bacteroidota bacterium]MDF2452691.1 Helix-turn-helix domain [Bacteroidota bacterium]
MPDFINSLYGKKLKRLRQTIDAKQGVIASRLNISQQAYSNLEKGKTNFSEKTIKEICLIFDITYHDFIILEDNLLDSVLSSKKTEKEASFQKLLEHYELELLKSELNNVKLEQKINHYIPYQEVPAEEAPPIYVLI